MKKKLTGLFGLMLASGILLTGCGSSPQTSSEGSSESSSTDSVTGQNTETPSGTEGNNIPPSETTELIVRFGDEGEAFTMVLEDNRTAQAIAGYVGTTEWRLPIYNYDESDVMQYYDIPSRYEIPDNSTAVALARAGDVFYSNQTESFSITRMLKFRRNTRRSEVLRQRMILSRQWKTILCWKAGATRSYGSVMESRKKRRAQCPGIFRPLFRIYKTQGAMLI